MATMSDVVTILVRGHFDDLIGLPESSQVEFKSRAYDLMSGKGRVDLWADIASFANARGGVILLGVETKPDHDEFVERAAKVAGVERQSINVESYEKSAAEHIHPFVRDLQFRRYSGSADARDVELFAILVEAQIEADKPFMCDRTSTDDGERARAHSAGWPTRNNAQTQWESAARVQQLVSLGLRGIATVAVGSPTLTETSAQAEADAQRALLEEIDDEDEEPGIWGNYILQALPRPRSLLEDFYGSFRQSVATWRGQRAYGFDLGLDWYQPEPRGTRLVAVADSGRRGLVVERGGVTSAAAVASPDFLGWGERVSAPGQGFAINAVVLIEFTSEFLRFVANVVEPALSEAPQWSYRASLADIKGRNLSLRPSWRPRQLHFPGDACPATTSDLDVRVDGSTDWERDAYQLIAKIYGEAFGVAEAKIPFAQDGRIVMTEIGRD